MIFTAIALVAFAGTSMGNTVEETQSESIVIETTKTDESDDCTEHAAALYETLIDADCGSPTCGGDDIGLLNDLMALCSL
ncbi:hypothetical protein [Flavobacterium luminosum]|uniref:Uncharacterized protein n=1 Tax=Flavobacterium luminosum TaxID=2949086 RepID=A0ABT0TKJ4_9FLAO|nr:hypothetical protein [Flavobacterium sp. HXWNR70]MCL9808017.1 hypothetical protein [Flavobacterium sp. HXWNR70]